MQVCKHLLSILYPAIYLLHSTSLQKYLSSVYTKFFILSM